MTDDLIARLRDHVNHRGGPSFDNGAWSMMLYAADALEAKDAEIRILQSLIRGDALQTDRLLSVNEAFDAEIEEKDARIAELEARINYIEAHVEGLVRTHSQFAAAAEGSWSGKKQRVRAAEASQILAFIRKEKSAARAALEKKND
jgi:uncharacterized protein YoxC